MDGDGKPVGCCKKANAEGDKNAKVRKGGFSFPEEPRLVGFVGHKAKTQQDVVLRGVGEGVIVSKLDAEACTVLWMFAGAGKCEGETVVDGMTGFEEAAVAQESDGQVCDVFVRERNVGVEAEIAGKVAAVRLRAHHAKLNEERHRDERETNTATGGWFCRSG